MSPTLKGQYWIPGKSAAGTSRITKEAFLSIAVQDAPGRFGLTRREMQILSLAVAGYTNREIARRISISIHAVKSHIANLFDKTGVCNRLELALFALHHGLVNASEK